MNDIGNDHFDLVVVGAGTGNAMIGPEFDDWRVAIVEKSVFGGTCLNRGCIPSKMFVHTADVADTINGAAAFGIDATLHHVRWPDIVDRVFGRIDPLGPGGEEARIEQENVTVVRGAGRFIGDRTLDVDGRVLTGDRFLLAAGARVSLPDIDGLHSVPFHTSDTIMRRSKLPQHLVIVGGGFISAEMAHVFSSLGSAVTIINRSSGLLRNEDQDVSEAFTDLASKRFNVILEAGIESVEPSPKGVLVRVVVNGESRTIEGDTLLVATGRVPNGDELAVGQTGVELDDRGYVVSDEFFRTNVDGIWAVGDITSRMQLKHLANAQAAALRNNLLHPDAPRTMLPTLVPHAVFTHPQIAGVGSTQQELEADGTPFVSGRKWFSDTAYGWALEDQHSFCKVLADPETRLLLGAHIIGPHASLLLQPLIQGMQFGLTVDELAYGQIYIHPALSEVIDGALREL